MSLALAPDHLGLFVRTLEHVHALRLTIEKLKRLDDARRCRQSPTNGSLIGLKRSKRPPPATRSAARVSKAV